MNKPKYMQLEAEMLLKGHTNDSLSEAIGISRAAFYNKRYGRTDFTRGELKKIIDILNLSAKQVEEIFLS